VKECGGSGWKAVGATYELEASWLKGRVRLDACVPGLWRLCLGNGFRTPGPLLAVTLWQAQGVSARPFPARGGFSEAWVRRAEVGARFGEGPANPVRAELRWRVTEAETVELEVTASSGLAAPLCHFEVLSASRLPRGPFLVPVGTDQNISWQDLSEALARRHWVCLSRDGDVHRMARDGRWPPVSRPGFLGCYAAPLLVYRVSGMSFSYVELGQPSDVERLVVTRRGGRLRWGFGLFGSDLEKGVLLRGRLWAGWVPRATDLEAAWELAEQLRLRPPSLSA
jgi:hypothetical protein